MSPQQQITKGRQAAGLFVAYFASRRKSITSAQYQVDTSYGTAWDRFAQPNLTTELLVLYREPVISSITFLKNKPLRSAASLQGITHINLLGTKRMRVGTDTRNISQLVPSMALMLTSRLDYLLMIGLGSQKIVGRKH